ncbi:MAG: BACON domain-containing carbohydrate-binding protein [Petrimonas mucosa]
MQSSTLALSVIALILFFLSGCGKEEVPGGGGNGNGNKTITLEVTDTPIHFPAEGGSKEITVTTNAKSWNVTSSKTWCTVSKETSHFTVTAAENKAFTPPEKAIVTVTAEGTTQKVTIEVTQDAAVEPAEAFIKPVTDKVIMNYQGGSNGIGIKTNITGWSCRSDQSWCQLEKISDEGIYITVDESWTGNIPRQALVTLYGNEGDSLASITVYQDPLPELFLFSPVGNTNIPLPSYGGTIVFTVITNVTEFTLGYVGEWLQVNKINDTQFTITSTPNNSTQMRPEQEIIVYASTLTQKLWVYEEEAEEASDNDDYDYNDPTGWD